MNKFICFGAITILGMSAALGASPNLPDLLPARGPMPPTYWEQHGWLIVALSVPAILFLAAAIYWFTRPKPPEVVPPGLQARRSLEVLRGQPEDGALLMKVSGVLRHYVIWACRLPPRERTTAELARELTAHPQLDPALAGSIVGFMRQCDSRKFAPQPPPPAAPAVDTALELVTRLESQPSLMASSAPPPLSPAARP